MPKAGCDSQSVNELRNKVNKYISNLWSPDNDSNELVELKTRFKDQLVVMIETEGKRGKLFMHHFYNDLRNCRTNRCPYCAFYFGSDCNMYTHKKRHEVNGEYRNIPCYPSYKSRKWTCICCGKVTSSIAECTGHLHAAH